MTFKTLFGDEIRIDTDNNILVISSGEKLSLKKIEEIGDFKFSSDLNSLNITWKLTGIIALILILIGIYLVDNPYISWKGLVSSDGVSLEEENRWPDFFVWISAFFLFIISLAFKWQSKQIKKIDYQKKDYELVTKILTKDGANEKERKYISVIICKGGFVELKELRKKILDAKAKADMI